MTMVAFDPEHAATVGIDVRRTDLAMMGLALIVTVIGLKIVGLMLIVALLIIPPVTARFWTDRVTEILIPDRRRRGGLAGYTGAAFSAAARGRADRTGHRAVRLRPVRPLPRPVPAARRARLGAAAPPVPAPGPSAAGIAGHGPGRGDLRPADPSDPAARAS
jgi:hypothetical protein